MAAEYVELSDDLPTGRRPTADQIDAAMPASTALIQCLATGLVTVVLAVGAAVLIVALSRAGHVQDGVMVRPGQPLLLISVDGLRADYLRRNITPTLQSIEQRLGVSAEYLVSQFPTKTFPNHYSIITGLVPDAHGIVDNEFYDPKFNANFSYRDPASNTDGRWWLGEPLWVTAARQGKRSAVAFWAGSEAKIGGRRPDIWLPYGLLANNMSLVDRIDAALTWLGGSTPPDFTAVYISDVDSAGHVYGPDSLQVNLALTDVDHGIQVLLEGLERIKRTDVNVIIVSDHGMSAVSRERVIPLARLFDLSRVITFGHSSVVHFWPANETQLSEIFEDLVAVSKNAGHFQVYLRDNLPPQFQYGHSRRVGPIVAVADPSYCLSVSADDSFQLGSHGYDNAAADMRAVLLAWGPKFNANQSPRKIPPVQNTDLYNMMCAVLGIDPAPNNGTAAGLEALQRFMWT